MTEQKLQELIRNDFARALETWSPNVRWCLEQDVPAFCLNGSLDVASKVARLERVCELVPRPVVIQAAHAFPEQYNGWYFLPRSGDPMSTIIAMNPLKSNEWIDNLARYIAEKKEHPAIAKNIARLEKLDDAEMWQYVQKSNDPELGTRLLYVLPLIRPWIYHVGSAIELVRNHAGSEREIELQQELRCIVRMLSDKFAHQRAEHCRKRFYELLKKYT